MGVMLGKGKRPAEAEDWWIRLEKFLGKMFF
jgi:hypothetical protein